MLGIKRFTLQTVALLMLLALSAMWAGPAFADDSVPPPETPVEEAPPPAEEPAAVVPESSDEAAPLAAPDAPESTEVTDPMWCPSGVTPFGAGCSSDYGSLNALVTDVGAGLNPTKAGTIWIEAGSEGSANPIVFDKDTNAAFLAWSAFDLVFQGGWSGDTNKTVNKLDPSVLSEQLYIDWAGAITLNDLVITATISDGGTYNALQVTTSKNILLERVTVQDSDNTGAGTYNGAYLDNTAGVGNVTINNSNFQNNEGDGLFVFSKGLITTNNLTGNLNGGVGAVLDNTAALTDKAVLMKGLKQFSSNGDWGLSIYSDGAVTISNVVANLNNAGGVYIDNTTSLTKQGVTVAGSNYFVGNTGGDGLDIYSQGTITAANLYASDNGGNGAYLDNCYDVGSNSTCDVTIAKAVTLTGVNTFNNNGADGLDIISYGTITVNSLNASNNAGNGAYMDNQWTNAALLPKDSVGAWTLNGYGNFHNNGSDGLQGYSHGNMTLNNVTANYNGFTTNDDGVDLSASKSVGSALVTFKGVNSFIGNTVDGLYVDADGKITLSGILANFNGGDGAQLITNDLGMGVTMTGTNTLMSNGDFGLYIGSAGAITISNLNASSNAGMGAVLDNANGPNIPTKPTNVTLSGSNSFNYNGDSGLEVYTFGAILINNLTANENGGAVTPVNGYGALLTNCMWTGTVCETITPKAVTLTGSVNATANLKSGLFIDSFGAITATNVTADGNGEEGAVFGNANNNLKPFNVTLKGSNSFNGNGAIVVSDGLAIYSFGIIALNNVTANFNSGTGAYLDNWIGGSVLFLKAVSLTGVNSFVGNTGDGVFIDANSLVTLNRVNADFNGGTGIEVSASIITLVCGHTLGNGAEGYYLDSFGAPIIIKGIYSDYNVLADFTIVAPTLTKACALP